MDSSSSDHWTRRSWQSQKKHDAHMLQSANMFVQAEIGREGNAEHANVIERCDSVCVNL